MKSQKVSNIVVPEALEKQIILIRGHRVMLDRDLARTYGVTTARLNEQIKRNRKRFPDDFVFQLTKQEMTDWISQTATSNSAIKMGLRKPPFAFTEHGAVAAAFVLNSPIAVAASVQIVRAFVRLREMVGTHAALARKLQELEKRYDTQFKVVFDAIRELMSPPETPRRAIGFRP
ncbi:MAG: ORF6N domain-containing protein [Elusimicrobiales bacterium]|jgi:hypothetical protein